MIVRVGASRDARPITAAIEAAAKEFVRWSGKGLTEIGLSRIHYENFLLEHMSHVQATSGQIDTVIISVIHGPIRIRCQSPLTDAEVDAVRGRE
jgi:hypothetical protein